MKHIKKSTSDKIAASIVLALVTAAGMCFCFWRSGIFPFGTNSNLFSDLAAQYASFLVFLKNSTLAEKIFSMAKGFGGQTFGLLSYYTFSPFNIIVFLFSPENIEIAMFWVFILKSVFMAENMYYYLSRHFDNSLFNIAVALMYTFYPFFTRYYFNILWTDGFALLPLLMLGTERIVEGKSGKLFLVAYVYSVVSNYYIAYMSSLFVLCWFVYRFVLQYGFKIGLAAKKAFTMAYYAALGLMLSAPVLLPSYFLLLQGKLGGDMASSLESVKSYNILTLPVSFFEGGMIAEYTPHLVGSVICIFRIMAYLLNSKIDRKERTITILFFGFIASSFVLRILGYVWHGFSAPQGFHNRQTFVYAFLMLIICRKAVEELDFYTALKTILCTVPLFVLAMVAVKKLGFTAVNTECIMMTFVTVAVTVVCLLAMRKFPSGAKTVLGMFMCVTAVYMGSWFMAWQYNGDKMYTMAPAAGDFAENYTTVENALQAIDDRSFYRIEDLTRWSQNQAMTHRYNSTSQYNSLFEYAQKEMSMYYGFDDTFYSITYNHSLPLNDFVFGIKYVLSSDVALVTEHYDAIYTGEKTVYYNPFWIPVIYTGSTNDIRVEEYWVDTVNNMAVALTGIDIYRADGNADYDKLKIIAEAIRKNECKLIENNGMFLSFSTGETENSYILSSLMYDENWHIKVNGVQVNPERYMNWFLSVPVQQGTDSIVEMTYIPQGLEAGLLIMVATLFILAVHFVLKKKKYSEL